jgi:endonuclease YncB( thermonuclease family)
MTTLVKSSAALPGSRTYITLREAVRKALLQGQDRIEREKVRTYWETGRLIDRHILHYKERADLGSRIIQRLAEDLGVSDRVLYRSLRFARAFPVLTARSKLAWAHYRALAQIQDEKKRLELTDRAERMDWSSRELEKEVAKTHIRRIGEPEDFAPYGRMPAPGFKPKLGKPGLYRIVRSGALLLDLGFSTFSNLSAEEEKRFKENDIVEAKGRELVSSGASAADLYTYEAVTERVIDGDTVWMRLHLGYGLSVRQKLRVRAIDAPELADKDGQAAKRFVEHALTQAHKILVTTTKPDKFDRYLSDLWLINKEGEQANLNRDLLKAGLARVKTDYSAADWGLENWGRF